MGEPVATTDVMSRPPLEPAAGADPRATRSAACSASPTLLGGQPVGSLNVYREAPYEWDDTDAAAVATFNAILEGLLGRAVAARRDELVVSQLQSALDRRVVIERAVGALMERHGAPAVSAFTALRRAARDRREAGREVAADVLDGADVPVGPAAANGPRGSRRGGPRGEPPGPCLRRARRIAIRLKIPAPTRPIAVRAGLTHQHAPEHADRERGDRQPGAQTERPLGPRRPRHGGLEAGDGELLGEGPDAVRRRRPRQVRPRPPGRPRRPPGAAPRRWAWSPPSSRASALRPPT